MKCKQLILIVWLVFVYAAKVQAQPEAAPGELIIKLRPRVKLLNSPAAAALPQTIRTLSIKNGVRSISALFANSSLAGAHFFPGQFLKLTFPPEADIEEIRAQYTADANIEYVQPNYIHKIDSQPNDPLFPTQVALQLIEAEKAWALQLASPNVIVGVIDTGIDYEHEDLREAVWFNTGEDRDGDGVVSANDFNGIDDDGNGFIDDIRGWDFTDAPSLADGGDFLTPDNDPFDENGHGTNVAGIIGATGNNGVGIAGLAFGCKIMALRAGTALGFLEEDDVASAIVYAVRQGAHIINMSFGDTAASPLLRDVMIFAHAQNCILVASAGNGSTDEIHFPSGFPETISVGATNADDFLSGFSNFGSSVDLVAPGLAIMTAFRGNEYSLFSGTSASAPFVSALAALILSKTPELSNEAVRGVLISSTDDLGEPGWDKRFAAGRINAARALASPYFSLAQISAPTLDRGFAQSPINIRGTVLGTFLASYSLQIGMEETPESWTEITRGSNRQMIDHPLFDLDIESVPDGTYTLRLIATNSDCTAVEDKIRFFIDRTAPEVTGVQLVPVLDGDQESVLLTFETDEVARAAISFRPKNSSAPFQTKALPFVTTAHQMNLTRAVFGDNFEFIIEATNRSGLVSRMDDNGAPFAIALPATRIGGLPVAGPAPAMPSGHLLAKASDFDRDGFLEVILSQYDNQFNFGPMKILEYGPTGFSEIFVADSTFIPRDWGDPDGDGLAEILAGRGGRTFLFEANGPATFPQEVVWQDGPDVWGSQFADLDRDGKGEIIVRSQDIFRMRENTGNNLYVEVATFPNPTGGSNQVGVPKSVIADFDGDQQLEILLGDFDGDLYIYENRADDLFRATWSERMPFVDTIDYLASGDFDDDGIAEFVVGGYSRQQAVTESTLGRRNWTFRIYKKTADDTFAAVWQQSFFGFQDPFQFDSGVSSGDFDNDNSPEIFISIFPDFYVIDYDPSLQTYKAVWYAASARSNATSVADFDADGAQEFLFNDGDAFHLWQLLTDFSGPNSPVALAATPLDSTRVRLNWHHPGSRDGFRIYRGTQATLLSLRAMTPNLTFEDGTVTQDSIYFYAVSAVDSSKNPPESQRSNTARVHPDVRPSVTGAAFSAPRQISLTYSRPMKTATVSDSRNYDLGILGKPESAITHKLGQEVILTAAVTPDPGNYTVRVTDVEDAQGTPVDTVRAVAHFTVVETADPPYLVNVELTAPDRLLLRFNEAMEAATTEIVENFEIEPPVKIVAASQAPEDATLVILRLQDGSRIGPFGQEHFLRVRNVRSQNGIPVRFGRGDTAALIFTATDLANVVLFPNPYRADSEQRFVTVAGLPREATVRILSARGTLIRTLHETDGNGGLTWDLRDGSGNEVASGIYLVYVTSGDEKKTGKLAIVR